MYGYLHGKDVLESAIYDYNHKADYILFCTNSDYIHKKAYYKLLYQ